MTQSGRQTCRQSMQLYDLRRPQADSTHNTETRLQGSHLFTPTNLLTLNTKHPVL
ncbi:hypothetical protein FOXYSP1_19362 [Fusarium oxysporum f. sp. phaseoli]